MKLFWKCAFAAVLISMTVLTIYYLKVVTTTREEGIQFIEPEEEYTTFKNLLQHPALENKIIYVDFWHTGCKPCLQEFATLPRLKEQLKQSDIVFLYLGKDRSVPGERFRWKKMVLAKRVTGYHYFITNQQFFAFWQETVKDKSIPPRFPHHLLINRQGQIVDDNAPGPASPKIVQLLQNSYNSVGSSSTEAF